MTKQRLENGDQLKFNEEAESQGMVFNFFLGDDLKEKTRGGPTTFNFYLSGGSPKPDQTKPVGTFSTEVDSSHRDRVSRSGGSPKPDPAKGAQTYGAEV